MPIAEVRLRHKKLVEHLYWMVTNNKINTPMFQQAKLLETQLQTRIRAEAMTDDNTIDLEAGVVIDTSIDPTDFSDSKGLSSGNNQ